MAVFLSDHGFGHAMRQFSVIEVLHESCSHLEIYLVAEKVNILLQKELKAIGIETKIKLWETEFGILNTEDNTQIDPIKTLMQLPQWIKTQESKLDNLKSWLQKSKVDLVISDISMFSLRAANLLKISTIAISNFTWYDQYFYYYQKKRNSFDEVYQRKIENALFKIQNMYKGCTKYLQLPLESPCEGFEVIDTIGLIGRKSKLTKQQSRKQIIQLATKQGFTIKYDDKFLFYGLGRSLDANHNLEKFLNNKPENWRIITSQSSNLTDKTIQIPSSLTLTQDILNGCDLIISKPGYSTIAEAILNDIPLILFAIDTLEAQNIIQKVKTFRENIRTIDSDLTKSTQIIAESFNQPIKLDSLSIYINARNNLRKHFLEILKT